MLKILKPLQLFYMSQFFNYLYFWIVLAVPFFLYRGLAPSVVFGLMSFYQIFGMILEYPTGVLGDRFGYKRMLIIGLILQAVSMLGFVLSNTYFGYLFFMFCLSLSSGFLSGNDIGLLRQVSVNIKRDTANYHAFADVIIFGSAIVAGYLASHFGYEFALILSGGLMFLGIFPLLFLNTKILKKSSSAHSFLFLFKEAVKSIRNPSIKQIFVIISIFGGFIYAIKSIIGSFGEVYSIDLVTVSFYVGISGFARAIGSKIYAHFQVHKSIILLLLAALSTLMIGTLSSANIIMNAIVLLQVLLGYLTSLLDGDLQELIEDHVSASIFSIKRILIRVSNAIILAVYGIAVDHNLTSLIYIGLAISMLLAIFYARNYATKKLAKY